MTTAALIRLGRWLSEVPSLPDEHADVAVVLGGHPRVRVPAAVDLLNSGVAPQIVLVGGQLVRGRPAEVWRGEEWADRLGVPTTKRMSLEREALGTVEEAHTVQAAAAQHGWKRVVVVTSPYHCRRALQVFESVLDQADQQVWVHPTPYDTWTPAAWPHDPRLRRLVGRELLKMAVWRTGLRRLVRPGR
ncbi:MAG: hypothetical protein CL927_17060 [Deltaproteobacteria bacterium]|nr:hypothetical protein [Deltaproteobacteria bacterium]HCH61698.1 hypothetical protein [Deltaproteobacteria bacterium]